MGERSINELLEEWNDAAARARRATQRLEEARTSLPLREIEEARCIREERAAWEALSAARGEAFGGNDA